MDLWQPALLALAAGSGVSLLLTPLAALVARRRGIVSAPRPDRWGGRPTPLLGGLAILIGALVPLAVLRPDDGRWLVVALAMAAAAALGLIDDVRHLRPTSKIVGQVTVASILAFGGVRVEIVGDPYSFALTVLWVVALMNAINLVDNMDGLAAGLAAIAGIFLVLMAPNGPAWPSVLAGSLAGASLGFLVHNFAPARVYMGDAGSHALGLGLAALALLETHAAASGVGLALLGPLLVLGLPIYDTALVALVRRVEGRPVSQGGRDHTSHRLAAHGLSDREAVVVLYVVAIGLASVGLLADAFGLVFLPLVGLAIVGLVLFGIFLAQSAPARVSQPRSAVLGGGRMLVRYGGEVALDTALATIALVGAYVVRFEGLPETVWLALIGEALPIVVPVQLAAFVVLGVYRTLWSHLGVGDLFLIARAGVVGTAVAAVLVFVAFPTTGQSKGALVIDGILFVALVMGARSFFLWLRRWASLRPRAGDRKVLIIGANDTGEVALRLLLRDRSVAYHPAGFLDDDPGKQRRRILGVPVLGRIADLDRVAQRQDADLVIVAIDKEDDDGRARIQDICARLGLESREFTHSF